MSTEIRNETNAKVISAEMKELVKSSPFYLMMLICAEESGVEESVEAIKEWEATHMPDLMEVADGGFDIPKEAKLIAVIYKPDFNQPFESNDLHGMIDEFLARVDATPLLCAEEERTGYPARKYYTIAKERFANV